MERIVTIVTPSYNQGKYIERTIQSVLSQAGGFFIDYIIQDGASTDESRKIIETYFRLVCQTGRPVYSRQGVTFFHSEGPDFSTGCLGISLRFASEKDGGQSDAINRGFSCGVGDVCAWLNSDDDYVSPGVIRRVLDEIDAGAWIVYGGAIAVDQNRKELWRHLPPEFTFYSSLFRHEGIPQPSIFWRREVAEAIGQVNAELHYGMDYDYWWRMLRAGFRFQRIDEYLSCQTYHPESKSSQGQTLFEAFKPEELALKAKYRKKLGMRYPLYWLRLKWENVLGL